MVRSFNQHLKEAGHQKGLGVTLLERLRRTSFHAHVIYNSSPNLLGTRGRFCERQFFQGLGRRDSFGMIQAQHIHWALLSLLYQLRLRSSGIRPQRLGNP